MKSIFWLVVVGALWQLTGCGNIPTQSASSQAPLAMAASALPQPPEQMNEVAGVTPLPSVAAVRSTNALQTADLWQRIRSGFKMPGLDTDLVHEQEGWYATRPEYLAPVIQILRGGGAGQPRDESAVLAELRAYGLQQAAARQSKDRSS